MIIGKVFQNGKLIGEGIVTGGKHYVEEYPEQNITLVSDTGMMDEKVFTHNDKKGIYFIEYQDNGNGWEAVYDSRERIDRTVSYPLPSFLLCNAPIPKHRHIYRDGDVETDFLGYY